MAQWTKAEVLIELPEELETAIVKVQSVTDTLVALLQALKVILEALAALELLNLTVAQALIKAALELIKSLIESFLQDTGVYILAVPIRRKPLISPVVAAALTKAGMSKMPPISDLSGEDIFLRGATVVTDQTAYSPEAVAYLESSANATGGNQGYVRTVLESLSDPGDANRPQFSDDAVTAGVIIVVGAPDYVSLLSLISLFMALIAPRRPVLEFDVSDWPVPRGLKGKPVAAANSAYGTSESLSILLDWTFDPPVQNLVAIDTGVRITEVAVIRSDSPALLTRSTVQELYGTDPLTKGLTTTDLTGAKYEVVDVLDYSGFDLKSTYLDSSDSLEKNKSYYYAVAYRLSVGTFTDLFTGGDGVDIGYRRLSSVIRVVYVDPLPRSASGTPPDWYRTPSVAELFPDLAYLLNRLIAFLDQFGDFTTGYGDLLKQYILWLEAEIISFEQYIEGIAAVLNRLLDLLRQKQTAGIYTRLFGVNSRGLAHGMSGFRQNLIESFANPNDPSVPPFTTGEEFVAGAVILAGAPTPGDLEPIITMLDMLFGAAKGRMEHNLFDDAYAAVEAAIDQAEKQVYGDDLSPGGTATTTAPLKVGEDDTGSCPVNPNDPVTFNDDLSVRPA